MQIYKESDGKNKKEKRKPVGEKFDFFLPTLTSHCQLKMLSVTTKITEPWNGLEFLYSDHSHFLLLTRPHFLRLQAKWSHGYKIGIQTKDGELKGKEAGVFKYDFFAYSQLKTTRRNVGGSAEESGSGRCCRAHSMVRWFS